MSGWRVLDLTEATGQLGYIDGSLVVRTDKTPLPVKVGLVDTAVVLVGTGVDISAAALAAAAEYGASVVVCDWKTEPVAALSPWSTHTRVGARQRAQLTASAPQRKRVWAEIIKSKVSGQAWVLRTQGHPDAQALKAMSDAVSSGDASNIEGAAAAFYWRRFGSGIVRDRSAGDPLNSALNYGYTVLRSRAINAVVAAGLHPGIGVFHHYHSNPFALADDVMEPFRPAVDAAVHELGAALDMELPETRKALVAASTAPMGNVQMTVVSELNRMCQSIGMFFEDKTSQLHMPVWRG